MFNLRGGGGVRFCITDARRGPNGGLRKVPAQWTEKTEFQILSQCGDAAATPEHWPKDIMCSRTQDGCHLRLKAITSLVHGGRPTHFERLKSDKKQMKNLPHVQRNNILRDTWCACYVSWSHKKNNEANTTAQVDFLGLSGRMARRRERSFPCPDLLDLVSMYLCRFTSR